MLRPLVLAVLAALLFYGILPVAGAFGARTRWRAFRRRLLAADGLPLLDLGRLLREGEAPAGEYRHCGSVEAIQGEDRVWTRGADVTVSVCLKYARIYLLPAARSAESGESYDLEGADETLRLTPWKRFSGLEEGARLYAAGSLRNEGGLPVFSGTASDPLLVLIYDGRDEDLTRRALWAGRHRNEYWNPVTLASLTAGFLAAGSAFISLLRPPLLSLPAALAASIALAPAIPFLPPGLALVSVYRRLWDRARRLRARRDLLRSGLPLPAGAESPPPDREALAEECVRKARKNEIRAGLAFSAALAVNFAGMVFLVRALIR